MTPFGNPESMISNLEQEERFKHAAVAIKGGGSTDRGGDQERVAEDHPGATETDDAATFSVCAGTSGAGPARALARPRRRAGERQAWRTGGAYES
jgi:hypothetical protein